MIMIIIGRRNAGEVALPALTEGVGVGTAPLEPVGGGGGRVAIGIPAAVQFTGVPLKMPSSKNKTLTLTSVYCFVPKSAVTDPLQPFGLDRRLTWPGSGTMPT